MAGEFVILYIPGLFAMATYEPLKKYLQVRLTSLLAACRSFCI
jgi:hypothetical protein